MKILFINNSPTHCGVQQYGLSTYKIISKSEKMDVIYVECNTWNEVRENILMNSPDIALYNYHITTMPWLINKNIIAIQDTGQTWNGVPRRSRSPNYTGASIKRIGKNTRHIGIIHEPNLAKPSIFNSVIQQADMPRILFDCEDKYIDSDIPIIGSFGFAGWHKGFHKLVLRVQDEYDNALIRLHMPEAYYCRIPMAKEIAKLCQDSIKKPGIKLEVDHGFFSQEELVAWLNKNTINIFHYERLEGAGNSSAFDQALSSKRPIGITKSYMFRHVTTDPSIFIEDMYIGEIIANGTTPLLPYYEKWSNENFIKAYESVLLK